MSGDLSLSTETASAGNSGALDFWKWLVCVRVGRLNCSFVGSGTDIEGRSV